MTLGSAGKIVGSTRGDLEGSDARTAPPRAVADPSLHGAAWLVVALASAATAALALSSLTHRSVWVDEVLTEAVATSPSRRLAYDLAYNGGNMSLYLMFMRGWLTFGTSDWWLRLPSVIFATACVPAFFVLSRRFLRPWAALVGVSLLAISPPLLHHAQDARSYALAVLLVILGWTAAARMVELPTRSRQWWYVVAAAGIVYSHFIGALFVGAQLLWLLTQDRKLSASVGARIVLLVIPQVMLILGPQAREPDWIPPLNAGQVGDTLRFLVGTDQRLLGSAVLVVVALSAVIGIRAAEAAKVPLLWVAVPFFGLIGVSVVVPMLVERYLVMTVPGIVLLICVISQRLPRLAPLALAPLLLSHVSGAGATLDRTEPDWRTATEFLHARVREDDAVMFIRSRHLVEHYWDDVAKESPAPQVLSQPSELGRVRRIYPVDVHEAFATLRDSEGAWVVDRPRPFGLDPAEAEVLHEIRCRWDMSESWSFSGGKIVITRYS